MVWGYLERSKYMIAKTAYLIQSPFDAGYENVPDLKVNTSKSDFIDALEKYFDSIGVFKYNILNYFANGYSLPYNLEQQVTLTFNNVSDKDILNKNYIIFTDGQMPTPSEYYRDIKIKDVNCCFYFIQNVEINNNAVGKSATFTLIKDLWTEYYDYFIEKKHQDIIRRHEILSNDKYTLELPATSYIEKNLSAYNNKKSVLFLKLLIDPSINIKYVYTESSVEVETDGKVVINRGTFREVLIPIQLYDKYGYIDTSSTEYLIQISDDLFAGYYYRSGKITLESQYILGAYLTFQPEIFEYNAGLDKIIFSPDYREVKLYVDNGSSLINTHISGVVKLDGSVSSVNNTIDISGYNNNPYYNIELYNSRMQDYDENIKITSYDLNHITLEAFLSCNCHPCMIANNSKTQYITKGKCVISHNEAGTQSGIVNRFSIKQNDVAITNNIISNFLTTSDAQIPVSVSQYDLYFQNNSNAHNFKKFSSDIAHQNAQLNEAIQDTRTALTFMEIGAQKGAQYASTGKVSFTIKDKAQIADATYNLATAQRQTQLAQAELEYHTAGMLSDIASRVSNINGTGTFNGNFYNDRVMFYYEEMDYSLPETRKYFYLCHIYGTNMPRIGYVSTNYRNRFDYVQTKNFECFIPNAIERNMYKTIFNNGTRKMHLEYLYGQNSIEYMYPNKPQEEVVINE